jgi:hypothetical protein
MEAQKAAKMARASATALGGITTIGSAAMVSLVTISAQIPGT